MVPGISWMPEGPSSVLLLGHSVRSGVLLYFLEAYDLITGTHSTLLLAGIVPGLVGELCILSYISIPVLLADKPCVLSGFSLCTGWLVTSLSGARLTLFLEGSVLVLLGDEPYVLPELATTG